MTDEELIAECENNAREIMRYLASHGNTDETAQNVAKILEKAYSAGYRQGYDQGVRYQAAKIRKALGI